MSATIGETSAAMTSNKANHLINDGMSKLDLNREKSPIATAKTQNGYSTEENHAKNLESKKEEYTLLGALQNGSQQDPGPSSNYQKMALKVYYHIDDEPTPYCVSIEMGPGQKITLGDFKATLSRSNFKFYCKVIDQEVGSEVKAEIRDEKQVLHKSPNGHYELFLLTAEGSSHSDGASTATSSRSLKAKQISRRPPPGPAPSSLYSSHRFFPPPAITKQGKAMGPNYLRDLHLGGHNRRRLKGGDSTIYTAEESDLRIYSDDESRLSTSTDNITSVSRQHHHNLYRRRNRRQYHRRSRGQPSRASSLSSMTETSMALEVITVTLNMDSVNFLGISIVGQSCARGDNGIYVANVMAGGAVALDGRIEPGDMILQVNEISFENFTNDQAVEVLKGAVNRKGPIKLTVAKSFEGERPNYFMIPSKEPVRPIDTGAWVQHTNAVRGMLAGASLATPSAMNSIPEGSEGAPTPLPPQPNAVPHPLHATFPFPHLQQTQPQQQLSGQRPATSSSATTSNGSGGGPNMQHFIASQRQAALAEGGAILLAPSTQRLDAQHTERATVLRAMAMPNSGLEIRDRTWLKISIPCSFLGSQLIDWLTEHVEGLGERKDAKKYSAELLKDGLIAHVAKKTTFSEQCYYVFGDLVTELGPVLSIGKGSTPLMPGYLPAGRYGYPRSGQTNSIAPVDESSNMGKGTGICQQRQPPSMVSEQHYTSCPSISPFPILPTFQQTRVIGGEVPHSQASNNSNEGAGSSGSDQHKRRAILPPAPQVHPPPNLLTTGPRRPPTGTATLQRTGNQAVEEYFVDHL